MKKIDNQILEEIARYNSINNYIFEQDATLPPPPGEVDPNAAPAPDAELAPPADPNAAIAPPAPAPVGPQPVDIANDPDVEKVGEDEKSESKTEEMDITDLVKSQKKVEEKQEEYFNNLFQHLDNLETKLGEMDGIMTKLNDLEAKVEKYREKTPQERLELRTLDSGPFNQKLSQFFDDKEEDMEKSGKNEYVLTQDEVEDYSPNEIKKTFRNFEDEVNPFRQVK
jgi:molecular chaperone GrpE (heat shock protein)